MIRSLLLCFFVAAALAGHAVAQSIFFDVNGDGACNAQDLVYNGVTSVDVYLDTAHNLDGSAATCPSGEPLTIYSYSLVFDYFEGCPGTSLTYGAWTDGVGFANELGTAQGGTQLWVSRGGASPLAAGKYKLGTLAITPVGLPDLIVRPQSTLAPDAMTSFSSACLGKDLDNTIKLGSDFFDVCGTYGFCDAVEQTTWGRIKARYR